MEACKIVAIGASAGGVKALQEFFAALPPNPLPIAYLVVIHMTKTSNIDYGLIYGQKFRGNIEEIFDKTEIRPGTVYFAPADYHVLIEKENTLSLNQDEPVNFARPSIDVTFSSLAQSCAEKCCGILMTGSNGDGAQGLKEMAEAGAFTLVQDPDSADYSAMPCAALELFKPDVVSDVPGIVAKVVAWAKEQ